MTYQWYFQKLSEDHNSAQNLIKNETDYELLKKAEKKFDNLREEFKNVA